MADLSFIKTYSLQQQTPLIHFQYDQDGAALRATEVKPKLDRYICEMYRQKHGSSVPKSWRQGEKESLRYRMSILAPSNTPECSTMHEYKIAKHACPRNQQKEFDRNHRKEYKMIHPMYFGNMVNERQAQRQYEQNVLETFKETVFYHQPLTLRIVCTNEALCKELDIHMESFFLMNNFGTRQTKGFGGFVVVAKAHNPSWRPGRPAEVLGALNIPMIKAQSSGNVAARMDVAQTIYAVMKGGINMSKIKGPDAYVKGYVQRRFLDDNKEYTTGSEKAFMKAEVIPGRDNTTKYQNYIFVRSLLGLADHYEFRDNVRRGNVNVYSLGKDDFDIERFASPVTVKVFDNEIFFLFRSAQAILGKEFYLVHGDYVKEIDRKSKYEDKRRLIVQYGKSIKTPNTLDWNQFITGFIQYYNSDIVKERIRKCGRPYDRAANVRLRR